MADGRIPLSHAGRGPTRRPPVEYCVPCWSRTAPCRPGTSRWPARNAGSRSCSAGITDTEDRRTVTAYATWRVLHRAATPRRAATGEKCACVPASEEMK